MPSQQASSRPETAPRSWGTAGLAFLVSVGVSAAVVAALSRGTASYTGIPVIAICSALAFVLQWLAFIPARWFKTEKFYDLTGSLTYLSVILCAVILSQTQSVRAFIIAALVIIWSGRLGWYLFQRIKGDGRDKRFDGVRDNTPRFFLGWTLQGLWVVLTLPAALVAITTERAYPLGVADMCGLLIWMFGFGIEATADAQKRAFRADKSNQGRFIHHGLWSWSRHPNYFGEIVIWIGIAVMASPLLEGWQWVAWISPLFVTLLLTKISGVPLLEEMADQRWGGQPDYERYKKETPVLLMRPPRRPIRD